MSAAQTVLLANFQRGNHSVLACWKLRKKLGNYLLPLMLRLFLSRSRIGKLDIRASRRFGRPAKSPKTPLFRNKYWPKKWQKDKQNWNDFKIMILVHQKICLHIKKINFYVFKKNNPKNFNHKYWNKNRFKWLNILQNSIATWIQINAEQTPITTTKSFI